MNRFFNREQRYHANLLTVLTAATEPVLPDPTIFCWCDSGVPVDECCGPILAGATTAGTAEALMRSRYSAYVTLNESYLLASWHPDTRPVAVHLDPQVRWLSLQIRQIEAGGADDQTGAVTFVARSKLHGRGQRLHERSRFTRLDQQWVYVAGDNLGKR